MITRHGVIIRVPSQGIRVSGRNTQGVKVMNLDEGDVVMDVARVVNEDDTGTDPVVISDGRDQREMDV
jgi:DNA gyrase subunit A